VGAQPLPLDLSFQLTDLEYKPLPGQTVRLILGEGQDWQNPAAGNRFVTDAEGKAQYTTNVAIDRSWRWVNVGFTPFSLPARTDHLQILAELVTVVPAEGKDEAISFNILYRMDVYRFKSGDCSHNGITSMYVPDAAGRFTVRVPPNGLRVPNSGGMVLSGEGYTPWDEMLEPAAYPTHGWKLKLAFKRQNTPRRM
jgi:hypothetical protein